MNELTHYLATRRSSLSVGLEDPGPSADQLRQMITIASRVPDHGKLAPWRFELWSPAFRNRLHGEMLALLESVDVSDKEKKVQSTGKILHAPCVIAVISQAAEHPKIPVWEQTLSAGAACMSLLMAANSLGFEAQWLTAWYIYQDSARDNLGLGKDEQIAGIIHIGSTKAVKTERPRPELSDIYSIRN